MIISEIGPHNGDEPLTSHHLHAADSLQTISQPDNNIEVSRVLFSTPTRTQAVQMEEKDTSEKIKNLPHEDREIRHFSDQNIPTAQFAEQHLQMDDLREVSTESEYMTSLKNIMLADVVENKKSYDTSILPIDAGRNDDSSVNSKAVIGTTEYSEHKMDSVETSKATSDTIEELEDLIDNLENPQADADMFESSQVAVDLLESPGAITDNVDNENEIAVTMNKSEVFAKNTESSKVQTRALDFSGISDAIEKSKVVSEKVGNIEKSEVATEIEEKSEKAIETGEKLEMTTETVEKSTIISHTMKNTKPVTASIKKSKPLAETAKKSKYVPDHVKKSQPEFEKVKNSKVVPETVENSRAMHDIGKKVVRAPIPSIGNKNGAMSQESLSRLSYSENIRQKNAAKLKALKTAELKECTFSPHLFSKKSSSSIAQKDKQGNNQVHDRLYNIASRSRLEAEKNRKENEASKLKDCTFTPIRETASKNISKAVKKGTPEKTIPVYERLYASASSNAMKRAFTRDPTVPAESSSFPKHQNFLIKSASPSSHLLPKRKVPIKSSGLTKQPVRGSKCVTNIKNALDSVHDHQDNESAGDEIDKEEKNSSDEIGKPHLDAISHGDESIRPNMDSRGMPENQAAELREVSSMQNGQICMNDGDDADSDVQVSSALASLMENNSALVEELKLNIEHVSSLVDREEDIATTIEINSQDQFANFLHTDNVSAVAFEDSKPGTQSNASGSVDTEVCYEA